MLVVFPPIFVADTKIIFRYDFVAPLTNNSYETWSGNKQNIDGEIILFASHAENEAQRAVSDLFLFFKKALCEIKVSGQQLSFSIF